MTLTPVLLDAVTRREHIHRKAMDGVRDVFPLQVRNHTLEIDNVHVKSRDFSSREQKNAILEGRTLQEALRGDVILRDEQGKVVDRKKDVTLAQLPYFTQRHTFIVDGNEYSIANQRRVRPGVYTRIRGNEELEAAFNLGKGENFRINMDPAKGHLFLQYGTRNIPLYPVLREMGVSERQLSRHWGQGVVDLNRDAFQSKTNAAVENLYERLTPAAQRTARDPAAQAREIVQRYKDTQLDSEVMQRTLGIDDTYVTPQVLVRASQKLLDVHRQGVDTDDRDSLANQTFHSVDDFIKERIKLEGRTLANKVRTKAGGGGTLAIDRVLPQSPFTSSLRKFVTNASLSAIPTQINPVEIIDSAMRVTSLGEGGIGSERAVPTEARTLHSTHMGFLDPARTPESYRAGIDVRSALWTKRDDQNRVYTLMRNAKSGKLEDVSIAQLENATIAFPGEMARGRGVSSMRQGEIISVSKKDVDFEIPHPAFLFSPATNTVPFIEGMQGNRTMMGAKMSTQALPLIEREAPLVQVESYNPGRTMEQELARLIVPTTPVDGIVKKIDDDYIYIQPSLKKSASADEPELLLMAPCDHVLTAPDTDEDGLEKTGAAPLIRIPYDTNFPLASKTYLHNTVRVKPGDTVKANEPLADSNFTADDRLALGKNLNVGFMAYYGKNSNDAVVISESAARKLTSEHMYKESLPTGSDIVLDKNKHRAHYGNRWTVSQYDNLDDQGVAKPGTTINPGDPVIIGLRKVTPTAEQKMLGKLHKSLATPWKEQVITWEHRNPGKVVDVVNNGTRTLVTVKTEEAAAVGDKIAGRYGNKGVIAEIIPDGQMVRMPDGQPIDILMTSAGIVSRVNPAQIIETAVAKVARKTGKPIVVPSMSGRDNVKWARALLKEHGLSDKEVLHNPVTGKDVTGPDGKGVMVGPQYIYKLFKSTETNYAARGVEDYDVNLQPAKGGTEGAKSLGRMEVNALLGHDARNVLREASTLKGSRNDEWWRAYQLGLPLPPMKTSFAYDKFVGMLNGAGIRVDKNNEVIRLGPMTDADLRKKSSGAITNALMVKEKDLTPEKGGLFDPVITGGSNGDRWSHVDLTEPIVNPTFEDPVRRMLGMTNRDFRQAIRSEGGAGIRKQLQGVDLDTRERELEEVIRTANGAKLDGAVKQLKAVRALKAEGLRPEDAYVISKMPIVPPKLRPILPAQGRSDLLVSDANYLYRDAILANETLKEAKGVLPDAAVGDARRQLYDATRAAFGLADPVSPQLQGRAAKGFISSITGQGSPKRGFFHAKLVKKTQDLTGRGTAAPDLTLSMDQVGLPEDMLWKTYEPHIMRGLVQQGNRALDAKQMIEERRPAARAVLMAETRRRPVIINRAPTLHRHSMIGAYPVPVPGKTIRVNPFIEQGMNLDFDGDALQIHVPASDAAINDVKSMTLSNSLFGDKSKSDLLVFPQHEAILGIHMASAAKGGKTKTFKSNQEALAAYKRGEIGLDDTVSIG